MKNFNIHEYFKIVNQSFTGLSTNIQWKSTTNNHDETVADYELHVQDWPHHLLVHILFARRSTPKLLMNHIHQISYHLRKSHQNNSIGMIFSEHLSDKARQICREEGVAYCDLSGNFFLKHQMAYILIEGAKRTQSRKKEFMNIYSPSGVRVVQTMLLDSQKFWKGSELASKVEITTSAVSKIKNSLEQYNWLEYSQNQFRLQNPKECFEELIRNDDFHKRVERVEYSALERDESTLRELTEYFQTENIRYAFTQWAAAQYYQVYSGNPITSLYVSQFPNEEFIQKNFTARKVESGGDLIFYKPKDVGVFINIQSIDGQNFVHPIQLYMDLIDTGLRGDDLAKELVNQLPEFKGLV